MNRLQKRCLSGYDIGNDRAVDVYEKIMCKIPGFDLIHFAVVEDLWRTYSREFHSEWIPEMAHNLEEFRKWVMEEVE